MYSSRSVPTVVLGGSVSDVASFAASAWASAPPSFDGGGVYLNVIGDETPTVPLASQLLTLRVCLPGLTSSQVVFAKFCAPPVVAHPAFGKGYGASSQRCPST